MVCIRRCQGSAVKRAFGIISVLILACLTAAVTRAADQPLSQDDVTLLLLGGATTEQLNELFLLTLPAHLQTMEGIELDSAVRNELRASYLRKRLATG
jgi:protein-arginine kinase